MTTTLEFPHQIPAARIGRDLYKTTFAADERQCAMLAKRYGVLSVESVKGNAELWRETDGMTIGVRGHFTAEVTQACVAALEPVKDRIDEDFEGWYLDETQAKSFKKAKKLKAETEIEDPFNPEEDEETMMPDEREEPESIVNGQVDVGELVAQYLSLAINPYPHSEKAKALGPLGDEAAGEKPNPFAVLKDMKLK